MLNLDVTSLLPQW